MTYRDKYLELLKIKNQYINNTVIKTLLMDDGGYKDFTDLIIHFHDEIKNEKRVNDNLKRIMDGEPMQYVLGYAYFVNSNYIVTPDVLIPRQETEQLVLNTAKLIKNTFNKDNLKIIDVCTGSGCIGISLAHIFDNASVTLSDISCEAIEAANKNIEEHELSNVSVVQGDMLEPFINNDFKVDVIVCNPPYIENESTIDKKTWKQEPHLALLAKPGTLFYEKVLKDYLKIVNDTYLICFEIGEDLETPLTALVNKYCKGCSFYFEKDMYDRTRFLYIKGKKE